MYQIESEDERAIRSRGRSGEVPRGEKMLYAGTEPESYITECTLVYEDYQIESEDERAIRSQGRADRRAGRVVAVRGT